MELMQLDYRSVAVEQPFTRGLQRLPEVARRRNALDAMLPTATTLLALTSANDHGARRQVTQRRALDQSRLLGLSRHVFGSLTRPPGDGLVNGLEGAALDPLIGHAQRHRRSPTMMVAQATLNDLKLQILRRRFVIPEKPALAREHCGYPG